MEFVNKIENMVGGWLKSVPHLPAAGQKWLGVNVWWIVLIGVILSGIGLLMTLGGIFTAMTFIGATTTYYGALVAESYTGMWFVSAIVSLIFSAVSVLILALAINPLKNLQKKGWSLLFLSWLVNAVAIVVNIVLSFSVLTLIMGIIFGGIVLAISAYFIFEIRGQFQGSTKKAKAATAATK
ncbi:MAG TPA: hypothetical protein PK265_01435 [Candidatus Saccharibacteria bacterium]|nr:hypothetical protein [Candidatus Saccharibacteria bacterium]HRQ97971.1 hypothetical protein [Candidatus Saccharibacteria bacterium]